MYRGFEILWSSVFEVVGGRPDLAENADGRVYARTEPGAGFRVGILVNPSENWICADRSWLDSGPVRLLESVVVGFGSQRDRFSLFQIFATGSFA